MAVAEIADYEVRRELLRAGLLTAVERLNELARIYGYLKLSTAAMKRAAQLWAEARRAGRPTAEAAALDCDVILAAQALVLAEETIDSEVVVATTNPRHLASFVRTATWHEII